MLEGLTGGTGEELGDILPGQQGRKVQKQPAETSIGGIANWKSDRWRESGGLQVHKIQEQPAETFMGGIANLWDKWEAWWYSPWSPDTAGTGPASRDIYRWNI